MKNAKKEWRVISLPALVRRDLTFKWLEMAGEARDEFLTKNLATDPWMDGLRSDHRYVQLMKGTGLLIAVPLIDVFDGAA